MVVEAIPNALAESRRQIFLQVMQKGSRWRQSWPLMCGQKIPNYLGDDRGLINCMKLPKMVIVNAIPILDYKFTSGFTSGTLMIESGLSSESVR